MAKTAGAATRVALKGSSGPAETSSCLLRDRFLFLIALTNALVGLSSSERAPCVAAGAVALRAVLSGRWRAAFGGIVVGIGLVYLVYGGHVAPPLHTFLSARPFIQEVAEHVDRSDRIGIFHAHRSMTAYYLNRQDVGRWNREQLEEAMNDGDGGFVIANPRYVREMTGLTTVLLDTLRSPFGKTKQLGLYRWEGGGG